MKDSGFEVSEFEHLSNCYVHFWTNTFGKRVNPLIPRLYRYLNRLISLVISVLANDPADLGSIPGRLIPKTSKMVLDTSLVNAQQYNLRIKDKVELSMERYNALSYTSVS